MQRAAREWRLLLLDGWLVGVSVFLFGWTVLRLTGSPLGHSTPVPALYWVPVELVTASVVTGLATRAAPGRRVPVSLLSLAALLSVTSDATWVLTRHPAFGVVEWSIMLLALGTATLTRRLDVWTAIGPLDAVDSHDPDGPAALVRPRLTRLSQAALVPGLLAAAVPGADPVTFLAATSLIVCLAVEIVLLQQEHHELWHALQRQAGQLHQLLRDSRDAIVQVDHLGMVEFANEAVADIFGYPPPSLISRNWLELVAPDDRATIATELARLEDRGLTAVRIAARFQHGDGSWRHLESTASRRSGSRPGYTLSVRDVSERNRLEADLRRMASTDALTGLFNRQAFVTMLQERLPRGDASVLFIDLDGFKAVNDTLGHAAGDLLLREVADALRDELRPGDIASRLGGDEFAVLPAVRSIDGSCALAARLVDRLGNLSAGPQLHVGASVGVATGHHTSAEALLRRADLAMYEAKAAGGRQYTVFEPGLSGRARAMLPHGEPA